MELSRVVIRPPLAPRDSVGAEEGQPWHEQVAQFVQHATSRGHTVRIDSEIEMLTPAEVASMLGISRPTVSRRIASGALASVKVGSHHRIPYPEVQRFWLQEMRDLAELVADDIQEDLGWQA